jgi:MraZ protein
MEPVNENIEPTTYYTSVYTHGVDEKRRVQIPAKWRPAQPGTGFTLILWGQSAAGACLRALPPQQMAQLLKDIDGVPNGDQKKTTLKRYIGSGSEQVTLDKAGRICLPEAMAKEAGLVNEAVLVGLLDRFEIWSPERYQRVKIGDEMMAPEALRLLG